MAVEQNVTGQSICSVAPWMKDMSSFQEIWEMVVLLHDATTCSCKQKVPPLSLNVQYCSQCAKLSSEHMVGRTGQVVVLAVTDFCGMHVS